LKVAYNQGKSQYPRVRSVWRVCHCSRRWVKGSWVVDGRSVGQMGRRIKMMKLRVNVSL